jgi:hypothetical protein
MGHIHFKEAEKVDPKGLRIKVYTNAEIAALNVYLQHRDAFNAEVNARNFNHAQCLRVHHNCYIARIDSVDWMVQKEGNQRYRKLFCLESWKRFNFGNKEGKPCTNQHYKISPGPNELLPF